MSETLLNRGWFRSSWRNLVMALAAGACAGLPSGAIAASYSFTPLGLLAGSNTSYAQAVSADASVAVGGTGSGATTGQATMWTQSNGLLGLDFLSGDTSSFANGASANGSVIVGSSSQALGPIEAFRWTNGGGMVGLGSLSANNPGSQAFGVSADGSVVTGLTTTSSGSEAFRWTQSDGMVGLGSLIPASPASSGLAVSADGQVIGGYSNAEVPNVGTVAQEAFRWTESDGMVGLGFLPGTFTSQVNAVSADGSVMVGTSGTGTTLEAFRWTESDGMVGLGTVTGEHGSEALAVSADGSVIVGDSGTSGSAFIWTSSGGMQDLREMLIAHGVSGLDYYALEQATGISADGKTVVGNGIDALNGHIEAWIVTVPEPSTLALAVLGVIALCTFCRRRKRDTPHAVARRVVQVDE